MAEPGAARRPSGAALRGRRLLVLEDDFMIATDLARTLEEHGAEVIGPAYSVAGALTLIEAKNGALDGAVLDVNLGAEPAYPVADALLARGVPFVFATGYDAWVIPEPYADVPRCEKPYDLATVIRLLAGRIGG
jgi:hypothetical protein